MDRLDIAALRERVDKLLDVRRQDVVDEFEEYEGVLDILWEQEFYAICLRIVEVSAKFPSTLIQAAFLRQIVGRIVGHLSNQCIAGMLESIMFENFCGSSKTKGRPLPASVLAQFIGPQTPEEESQRPGVR